MPFGYTSHHGLLAIQPKRWVLLKPHLWGVFNFHMPNLCFIIAWQRTPHLSTLRWHSSSIKWLQSSWPLIQMISWLWTRCKDHFHISFIFHKYKKFLWITARVQHWMKSLQFAQLFDQIVIVYSMRPWWMVLVSCLEVDCTWLGLEAASLYCADAKQRWNMFLSFPPTHKLPREYSPLPTNQPLAHQKFENEKKKMNFAKRLECTS